jgi:3-oxoacyl-[acyl-carrier-protein] synthase-1
VENKDEGMRAVFAVSDSIVSPISDDVSDNVDAARHGRSAIALHAPYPHFQQPFAASLFKEIQLISEFTRFESLCIYAVQGALKPLSGELAQHDTLFLLSTTKGNIERLESGVFETMDISPFYSAEKIARYFGYTAHRLVVSNACISGVLAIGIAQQLLAQGSYQHAIVCAADVLSSFVISGFYALGATSNEVCKPFDKNRKGINLGECAAAIVLSTDPALNTFSQRVKVGKGFTTNDANHLSGPSKTGEELAWAIKQVLVQNKISFDDISFVNAHGTGTIFNDEMEAKAFGLSGVSHLPINSFKPLLGHTLGAAGAVESVLVYHSLLQGEIFPSLNFEVPGTSVALHVNQRLTRSSRPCALKTASGFGGCNAAIAFMLD